MLRNMKDFEGYSIGATDGVIGRVMDFYFDDDAWVIRYLVVEVADRQPRRLVLISPMSIGQPNWSEKVIPASITRAQVRNSPDIDTDKPISRQQEMGYLGYYGYPNYWGGGGLWGGGLYPDMLQGGLKADTGSKDAQHGHYDPHLRSGNACMRYYVHATDGDIGHLEGFLVDERSWAVRYLIVNTSNWWLGHKVLVAPDWIDHMSWAESMVVLDLTRDAVKNSPPYDPAVPLGSDQGAGLRTMGESHTRLTAADSAAESPLR
jgi:hypothetical protein